MAIMMNEFVPVLNIAPSSDILFCNNLSYVISITFFWQNLGMETSDNSNRSLIWGVVAYIVV